MALATPSQTVGPFFIIGLPFVDDRQLVEPDAPGAIRIEGVVADADGVSVNDALVEIWQADRGGRYFPNEAEANGADPVLLSVDPELRHTLVARDDDGVLRFDIRLQGDGETVFFDV